MNPYHLILINGWASTAAVWEPILTLLRESQPPHHTVTLLDWTQALANPVQAVREKLSCDLPNVLLGWSLGGMLALEAACASELKIAGVLLAGSTARMCTEGEYPGADPRAVKAMKLRLRRDPEALLRDFSALCFVPVATNSPHATAFCAAATAIRPDHLAAGLEYLLTRDLRALVPSLGCPLHLLHADNDMVIPAASAAALARLHPDGKYTRTENGGHALPITCPEAIIWALSNLLNHC